MSDSPSQSAKRPTADKVLVDIADYVMHYQAEASEARETARYCLMDSLGCAILALNYPACSKLLGPVVEGATLSGGARVPGTDYELDPAQAAFNIGTLIRWLDFNDTWLAAEWGHPSDNLGAILATADYVSRQRHARGEAPLTMAAVLSAMIQAYEIQGVLALENSFNSIGLDHVLLVRVASTAVTTAMLGGDKDAVINALSQAWIDGGALRTYRHTPNTGSRKSWAAGDATRRAVQLALLTLRGEMGSPSALTAKHWGFYDVLFEGSPFRLKQDYGSYVMPNILFKLSYPAEFHAQTAVEGAMQLHAKVANRLDEIQKIVIETQEAAVRIIDKTGPLHNPADRDHCLQYMVAVALIFGRLTADDYEDDVAGDERIDELRERMEVKENKRYSKDYMDPDKRAITNSIQVFFKGGGLTERVEIKYPIGHRRRRSEGIPLLQEKFANNIATRFSEEQCQRIQEALQDQARLEAMPVHEFMELWRA